MALFRPRRDENTIETLYGAIVAQARLPVFYAEAGVPDTVEGRFDMIVLHLALFLRRLRTETGKLPPVGQAVFDHFCTDMDHNLREMGVGEMAVPRRMKRFGEAFYGRSTAYDAALDSGDVPALEDALARNLRPTVDSGAVLARYVREAARLLADTSEDSLRKGEVRFPAADKVLAHG
ncbi:ubiquinol-cytochrome C chaperone [Variibacter gotjawalensis]|uniref:Ubiquinol-cytochrome C chaperone n=1 Tax=Variibacter gotjawalensis TaxID=1333996 RepID=A0A0S3PXA3_9BRAD|nr:ubiquinol-cytochrome C chaperone family protein [Variibacter gotjawalensis]NIK46391.1 cytochrome b pre-mRNA-processing protein 3 [Variibacter gotjawalensis]RZS48301.1 cytochrome b pre-mRNA-processing protein 3 [Variibacter gotjawalensis]BAT60561.1 ubiquinol-cytochrome C chaperone [Variibacter gotjawalensis]